MIDSTSIKMATTFAHAWTLQHKKNKQIQMLIQ